MNEEVNSRNPGQDDAKSGRLYFWLFGIVVLLVLAGAFTLAQRHAEYQALAKETETLSVPTVAVIRATPEGAQEDLVLPGTLQAYVESPIYARTNGYVKKWYHDLGGHVRQGEVLADIDTPEVDQELSQSRATRQQIAANMELARSSAERWENLRKSDSVSQQEVDERTSAYAQMQANLAAADANVKRLEELESFKHVLAPFSGVITRRNVDIGMLVNAGNGGSSQQLFVLAQTDPVRVFVSVPEMYAPAIRAGLPAYLELGQYPGQKFAGAVVRNAESFDLATRTLLTEVDVPNHQGLLLPGGYAQVHLQVRVTGERMLVPANALLFRSEGLRAVVMDSNHRVHLRQITLGRDYGTSMEVLQGISKDDWLIVNPADSLEEGQEVRVQSPASSSSGNAMGGAQR